MAQARPPAKLGAFPEVMEEDGSTIRMLLERIAVALNVPVENPAYQGTLSSYAIPARRLPESLVNPDLDPVQYAKMVLAGRQARATVMPAELLGEPGFDLLLHSYIAWSEQRDVPLQSACRAASASSSVALRWISHLVGRGLLDRIEDITDGQFKFIRLTEKGVELVARTLRAQQRACLPMPR